MMSHQYDSVMKKANLKNYGSAGSRPLGVVVPEE
jgi:hypothetical protein